MVFNLSFAGDKEKSISDLWGDLSDIQNKKKQRELERRVRQLELERELNKKKPKKNLSDQEAIVKMAKEGNVIAQWFAGLAFMSGEGGFELNPRQGKFWLEESIKKYFSPSMVTLGWYYYTGEGIEKDFKKSLQLNENASMLGHPMGSYNIAFFFFHGQLGLDNDFDQSKKYFIISAEQYLKSFNKEKNEYCLDLPEDEKQIMCYKLSEQAKTATEELNLMENNDPKMIKLKESYVHFLLNPSVINIDKIKLIN